MTPRTRNSVRIAALVVAILLFACAWYISQGKAVLDSTNGMAWRNAGLMFLAVSFLP